MSALSCSRRTCAVSLRCRVTCSPSSRRTVRRLHTSRARPSRMASRSSRALASVLMRVRTSFVLAGCAGGFQQLRVHFGVLRGTGGGRPRVSMQFSRPETARGAVARGRDTNSVVARPARDEWIGRAESTGSRGPSLADVVTLSDDRRGARYAVRTPTGPAVNAIWSECGCLIHHGASFRNRQGAKLSPASSVARKRHAGDSSHDCGPAWSRLDLTQPAAIPGTAVARDMNRVTFSSTMMSLGRSGRVR